MPPTINYDRDWPTFLGLETVSLARRSLKGEDVATLTGVQAVKRATLGGFAGAGMGAVAAEDVARWHLRAASLPAGFRVRRGDRIVSDTHGTWEVLASSLEAMATRFACECKAVPPA